MTTHLSDSEPDRGVCHDCVSLDIQGRFQEFSVRGVGWDALLSTFSTPSPRGQSFKLH